ncbi:glycosyltransferase family 2 protein [Collinsella sp. HCP28S3_E12]|uniref:glycosyltransferase family 2 protein n=1 Tax=Collinsella sp. HCP28S3_E12 TaxID=3438921 RepID=UPI003F89B049
MIDKNVDYGLVSIIMPSYNSEHFIAESIKSVQAQTYKNWELLLVDDHSNDATVAIADSFAVNDRRIRVLVNECNSGAAFSRNRALRKAKGAWAAFLDSDDTWASNKLQLQLKFMRDNDCCFSYTEYETMDESGKSLGQRYSGPKRITRAGMRRYCWPGCLTVMYDTRKVGLVQIADLKKHNDYAMWLSVAKKAECLLLPEVLGKYRIRESSISHGSSRIKQAEHLYRLWRTGEACSRVSSLLHTAQNIACSFYKKAKYIQAIRRIQ